MSRLLIATLIIASGSCAHRANPEVQKLDFEAERYAIYSLVLNESFVRPETKLLVIEEKTSNGTPGGREEPSWDYVKQGLAPIPQALIDDFKSKNASSSPIENKFGLTVSVTLISQAEVEKIFGQGGGWWEAFYKKYPNSPGLISFSNVGFNQDGTEALLYVGSTCDGLCGSGHFLLLTKTNGKWKVERRTMTWIS